MTQTFVDRFPSYIGMFLRNIETGEGCTVTIFSSSVDAVFGKGEASKFLEKTWISRVD